MIKVNDYFNLNDVAVADKLKYNLLSVSPSQIWFASS
jgi:hypothetical protein